jgi:hypothetical protein
MQRLHGYYGYFEKIKGRWIHRVTGLKCKIVENKYAIFCLELGDDRPDRYKVWIESQSPMCGGGSYNIVDTHERCEFPRPLSTHKSRKRADSKVESLNKEWRILTVNRGASSATQKEGG